MKKLIRFVNWGRIRWIGQLQILARASYVAILVVPILAGLWPAVRIAVNRYNQVAGQASEILDEAHRRIDGQLGRLASVSNKLSAGNSDSDLAEPKRRLDSALISIGEAATDLRGRVDRFAQAYDPQTLESPRLPLVWVFAYLAALFVVLGHCFYQVGAPEPVKGYSKTEYVVRRRDERSRTKGTDEDVRRAGEEAERTYESFAQQGSCFLKCSSFLCYILGLVFVFVVICLQICAIWHAAF